MAERITVTAAEQLAAREIVKLNTARGLVTRPAIVKIANASAAPRSAGAARADSATQR